MSFLQQVQKVPDTHYVLPKVGDMHVDVHAYLSDTLFEQTNEVLWCQAACAAAYPGMIGFYLMPDTHLGYGIPVGGVAVTEDVIIQVGSGYDISCGVVYLRVPDLHAVANRHIIVRGVQHTLENVSGVTGEVYYEISHNLVQEETLVLPDGSAKRGFVHRKGATGAFPAGRPDLVGTQWQETGHPCLVPGSMKDGAAILFPPEGAYASGCSVNHGSGRVMARGQAKRELADRQDEIDRSAAEKSRAL